MESFEQTLKSFDRAIDNVVVNNVSTTFINAMRICDETAYAMHKECVSSYIRFPIEISKIFGKYKYTVLIKKEYLGEEPERAYDNASNIITLLNDSLIEELLAYVNFKWFGVSFCYGISLDNALYKFNISRICFKNA